MRKRRNVKPYIIGPGAKMGQKREGEDKEAVTKSGRSPTNELLGSTQLQKQLAYFYCKLTVKNEK